MLASCECLDVGGTVKYTQSHYVMRIQCRVSRVPEDRSGESKYEGVVARLGKSKPVSQNDMYDRTPSGPLTSEK